jgi:cellulose synthase/poly-beta-1,6-N-acetylglucosamine synthase-like glycosyltransferase
MRVAVIRDDQQLGGYIDGRNRIMRQADTPFVLLLDDDSVLYSAAAVLRAVTVLERDATVAAIAFAQAEADGSPWAAGMQAGRGQEPACVAAFIGFAHLLRREAFLRLGGYRASLGFYGEEKDFCIRVLDAGMRVVYLPDALVGHVPDPGGRSVTRYLRFVIRNDCLYSLFNEPWPLVAVGLPVRLWRYRRMAAGRDAEPGGIRWILSELMRLLPEVRRDRRAVGWSTIREWRRLARTVVPYDRRQEAGGGRQEE